MRTGFNLLLWTTHVDTVHLPLFEKLKAAGYDGVEIPLFEGSVAHFEQVGRAIRDNGLGCTTVTVLPDAAHSAISPDPASRQGALETSHRFHHQGHARIHWREEKSGTACYCMLQEQRVLLRAELQEKVVGAFQVSPGPFR